MCVCLCVRVRVQARVCHGVHAELRRQLSRGWLLFLFHHVGSKGGSEVVGLSGRYLYPSQLSGPTSDH